LRETASLTGAIMLIIATATAMAWALTQSGFADQLATALSNAPGGKAGFMALSVILFLVLGSILEGIPAIVLFGPLLFPIAKAAGIAEVHFAIVAVLAMGVGLVLLMVLHLRHPLPIIPTNWMGKGQLFYLVFLWSIVAMNFTFVLPRFTPIRLVTEWFICLNATFCSVFVFYASIARQPTAPNISLDPVPYTKWIRRTVLYGVLGAVIVCFLGFGLKLACWGNQPAGQMGVDPIRFGPNNTNDIP